MGSVLTIPRHFFACGGGSRQVSVFWLNRQTSFTAWLVLSFLAAAFVERLNAQGKEPSAAERPKPDDADDIYTSPYGLLNNVGLHVVGPKGRHGELECELDGLNTGSRTAELSCLMHPEIQSVLELTEQQIRELTPVFEQAAEVIWRARWERRSKCESIKNSSVRRIQALAQKLNDGEFVQEVLLPHQFKRLLEIERRFLFNIHASTNAFLQRGHTDKFFKLLKMDRPQVKSFSEALEDAAKEILEDNVQWENKVFLPMLQEMLTGKAHEEVSGLTKDAGLFSAHPVVRFAQMSPLFLFAEVEKFPSREGSVIDDPNKLDLTYSVFEPVILINGRFTGREDFILRDRWGAHPKWRNFLMSLKFQGNSWLELSDDQHRELGELLWTDPPAEEGGVIELRHFGDDRLELHRMKWFEAREIGEKEYRQMEGEYRELASRIDEELGERLMEILLPYQRERLQFAMGASQLHQLGIWHLLRYEMLGSPFSLTPDQAATMEKEITHRRKVEFERLVRFEEEMRGSLPAEQRDAFTNVFGEPVPHLPTMLFAFLDSGQEN
jgi:hypothetical protein